MPEEAEERRRAAWDQTHLTINHHGVGIAGTSTITGEIDYLDALDLDDALRAEAQRLGDLGNTKTLDQRRATALGNIARRDLTLDYPTDQHDQRPAPAAPRSPATRKPPAGRQVVLHLHLSESAIRGTGTCRRSSGSRSGGWRTPGPRSPPRPSATGSAAPTCRSPSNPSSTSPNTSRSRPTKSPTGSPNPPPSETSPASSPGAPDPPADSDPTNTPATTTTPSPTTRADPPAPARSPPCADDTTGSRPTAAGPTTSSNPGPICGPAPTATSTSATTPAPSTSPETNTAAHHPQTRPHHPSPTGET